MPQSQGLLRRVQPIAGWHVDRVRVGRHRHCASTGRGTTLARLGRDQPRHHFDDFFWAFITIFQVLTGENWNEVMYDGMRTKGDAACLYFILLVVIGNYIVLNLFLAILLDNFADMDSSGETAAETAAREARKAADLQRKKEVALERRKTRREEWMKLQAQASLLSSGGQSKSLKEAAAGGEVILSVMDRRGSRRAPDTSPEVRSVYHLAHHGVVRVARGGFAKRRRRFKAQKGSEHHGCGVRVPVRLEAAIKMFALGIKKYFASGWNLMDFVIVFIGAIGAILELSGSATMQAARSMRSFRALRPMRMAARADGMRIVIEALFQAIPPIMNVALVCILFYLIFGILGLNLFMGKMYRCVYDGTDDVINSPAMGIAAREVTKRWCTSGTHLTGCVGGARVALYSSGADGWACTRVTSTVSELRFNRRDLLAGRVRLRGHPRGAHRGPVRSLGTVRAQGQLRERHDRRGRVRRHGRARGGDDGGDDWRVFLDVRAAF